MATTRHAHTVWEGDLLKGKGVVTLDSSGIGSYDVSWPARSEAANGKTSPEELIAAAHSSCFSMALSHGLAGKGNPPTRLETKADVTFQPGEASPASTSRWRARSRASTTPLSSPPPRRPRRTARSARP